LFLGNFSDNQRDAYAKKRRAQPRGGNHVNAKLTNKQAWRIRALHACGVTQVELARRYGVSQVAISLITRGKTYR
jgi:hypothetical protein